MNKKVIGITIILTALITGSAVYFTLSSLGTGQSKSSGTTVAENDAGEAESEERKIIYWKAPMDPTEIYDEPGKSKMGMDLVPVYEDEVNDSGDDSGDRKIVYWKAPMDPTEIYDEPGKSKMGMDLVPVYEDELVGGVDIKISPVMEQNMGLKVEMVEKGLLDHTIKTYGHVTVDETRTGTISQKYSGWIEKLYVDYTGFEVEVGQPLFDIYSPALLASQEEYLSAYKNFQRSGTPLNKELLASARKRLQYFDIADPEIVLIEKTGSVQKTLTVRSPFKGVVTHKNVTQGDSVKTGVNLYTIADLGAVWVEAHIFEYEQSRVYVGQPVEMKLSYNPDKIYKGQIAYIFPYLQPKTRDVIIRIAFDNPDGELKPDMFAQIKIDTSADDEGLSIASQAVIHSGDEQIVFVAKGKGKFSPRSVTTGLSLENGRVQVLSGLTQGENIVVSGQFLLDSESKLKEAIQKMIESKSQGPVKAGDTGKTDNDEFFDDMNSGAEDNFFNDMK